MTINSLYKRDPSIHRNKLIANILYLSGQIDNWGGGTLNIIKEMKKEELQLPEFDESNNYFHIIFKRPKDLEERLTRENTAKYSGLNVPINVGTNVAKNVGRTERLEIILNKIKNNIRFTIKSLAKELTVNEKTIERDLELLKKQNKIIQIGSKRQVFGKY